MPAAVRAPHFVRSFERGLAVIRSFDAEHPARTLSEVARACELTRAAARRLLLTLADLGYVRSDGRLFRLTPRVLELGYAYLAGSTLPQTVTPHLEQLVARTGESASLCVLDGDDAVHVACLPAPPRPGRHHHRGHPATRPRHRRGPGAPRPSARRGTGHPAANRRAAQGT